MEKNIPGLGIVFTLGLHFFGLFVCGCSNTI